MDATTLASLAQAATSPLGSMLWPTSESPAAGVPGWGWAAVGALARPGTATLASLALPQQLDLLEALQQLRLTHALRTELASAAEHAQDATSGGGGGGSKQSAPAEKAAVDAEAEDEGVRALNAASLRLMAAAARGLFDAPRAPNWPQQAAQQAGAAAALLRACVAVGGTGSGRAWSETAAAAAQRMRPDPLAAAELQQCLGTLLHYARQYLNVAIEHSSADARNGERATGLGDSAGSSQHASVGDIAGSSQHASAGAADGRQAGGEGGEVSPLLLALPGLLRGLSVGLAALSHSGQGDEAAVSNRCAGMGGSNQTLVAECWEAAAAVQSVAAQRVAQRLARLHSAAPEPSAVAPARAAVQSRQHVLSVQGLGAKTGLLGSWALHDPSAQLDLLTQVLGMSCLHGHLCAGRTLFDVCHIGIRPTYLSGWPVVI